MSDAACVFCGGPAAVADLGWVRIATCPCVPLDRAYIMPSDADPGRILGLAIAGNVAVIELESNKP